jgi:hypothetical protein
MPVIGWLSSRNAETDRPLLPAFHQGPPTLLAIANEVIE